MLKQSFVILLCLGHLHCSKAGEPAPESKSPESREIGVNDQDLSPIGSSIVVALAEGLRTDTLEGYVIGYRETIPLLYNEERKIYLFQQVPPGLHDIMILSQDDEGNPIGKRVNGIEVNNTKGALVNDLGLSPVKTLIGNTHLVDGGNCEGAVVSIPGTHISTTTDGDGNYTIEGVPEGNHRFEFSFDGYQTGFIDVFKLTTSSAENMPTIILGKESARGIYPASSLDQLAVSFLINPPANANEFRISQNQSFAGSSWTSLISTTELVFEQPGLHTVYVQFANHGTQLSSIFSTEIEITIP